ncbi:MAG: hypothetical protein EBS35_04790 [Bacteroidetes bacterium]|nr:hypothetical protein [Bacteroidota bacterium]
MINRSYIWVYFLVMNLKHCLFILTSLFIPLLHSCKKEKKKEVVPSVVGSVYVRYLNPEGYYTVQVEFGEQLSDSTLQKPNWKSVPAFNNFLLQERPRSVYTRFYSGEFLASYQKEMKVDLIHCPKGLQKINLFLSQPKISVKGDKLIASADFFFTLEDEKLVQSEETLVILLIDENQQAVNLEIKGPQPDNEFIIPAGFTNNLKKGKIEFNLIKKKIYSLKEGNSKILINLEHYSPPIILDLQ